MVKFIVEYWHLIIIFASCAITLGVCIYNWLKQPTKTQIANIKAWLLYAVTEAEAMLGSKTGQLKLHMVYDMAIERFHWLSVVSFEKFSEWVDEALDEMRSMLSKNESINKLVTGENK